MECPSPPVDFETLINAKRQSTQQQQQRRRKRAGLRAHRNVPRLLTLRIGFLMDNVESVRDLKKHFQNLQYVEDPIYSAFTGASLIKLYKVNNGIRNHLPCISTILEYRSFTTTTPSGRHVGDRR